MVKPSTLAVTAAIASTIVVAAAAQKRGDTGNLRGGGDIASTTRDAVSTTKMTTGALLQAGGLTNPTVEFNEVLRNLARGQEDEDASESGSRGLAGEKKHAVCSEVRRQRQGIDQWLSWLLQHALVRLDFLDQQPSEG
jgi:hypothetical protein